MAIAHETVARHLPGTSVIDIRTDAGVASHGRPVSVITVVNDNMPFLFDSVLGEITESAGEPTFVIHPVVPVRHGKTGVDEILREGGQAATRTPTASASSRCMSAGCRRTGRKG